MLYIIYDPEVYANYYEQREFPFEVTISVNEQVFNQAVGTEETYDGINVGDELVITWIKCDHYNCGEFATYALEYETTDTLIVDRENFNVNLNFFEDMVCN